MSDFLDVIKQRRSIRKYKPTPVTSDILRELIVTASYAPSAHNAQPWRFIAITEQQQKEELAVAMGQVWLKELEGEHVPKKLRSKTVNASVTRFASAPALVLCCLTMEEMDKYPDLERQKSERDLAIQSLAAAIQNLLLAAYAKGLATCWYCAPLFCKEAVRKALRIPDYVEPHALITVGYAAESREASRRSVDEIAYFGFWGGAL